MISSKDTPRNFSRYFSGILTETHPLFFPIIFPRILLEMRPEIPLSLFQKFSHGLVPKLLHILLRKSLMYEFLSFSRRIFRKMLHDFEFFQKYVRRFFFSNFSRDFRRSSLDSSSENSSKIVFLAFFSNISSDLFQIFQRYHHIFFQVLLKKLPQEFVQKFHQKSIMNFVQEFILQFWQGFLQNYLRKVLQEFMGMFFQGLFE